MAINIFQPLFARAVLLITILMLASANVDSPLAAVGEVKSHQKISDTEGGFTGILDDLDEFGVSSTGLGDLDGDGVADMAVGAWFDSDGGVVGGAVWVLFLNSDGTVKSHQKISSTQGGFTGTLDNSDHFGTSVASLGDLDGDGIGDLAVGANGDDDGGGPSPGAVWVLFLNSDGTVKSHQKISDTEGGFTGTLDNSDDFGHSVASLGDLDGDGVGDLAVGAFLDGDGGYRHGAVWVLFLKSDGTVKSHQKISDTQGGFTGTLDDSDLFGASTASLGDLDGDGVGDLAVGAYADDDGGSNHGAVWVLFLNSDGTVKSHQKISDTQGGFTGLLDNLDNFGVGVASLGDLDCDGVSDLAVGAVGDDDGGSSHGAVWVLFLNSDGTVKSHQKISDTQGGFTGTLDNVDYFDYFGWSVASLGDLDGDGVGDLAVGALGDDDGGGRRGAVWVLFPEGPGFTPVGPNIVIEPKDCTTGTSPVTLTFDHVATAGETELNSSSTGPPPPAGFKIGNPPTYYELTTTAEFTGSVEICIDYGTLSFGNEAKLKLFHYEDGHWEDRTVSLDTGNDIICAEVTSFSTFAIFELNIGSVAGYVTADCPEPGAGFIGVEIDAYLQGNGDLLGSDVTDADGYYQIDSLEAGVYIVTVVTPLSYKADEDEVPATVVAGEVATADFSLTCLNITPSQRSKGFWKHQVGVATGGKGNAQIDAGTMCGYLDLIEQHFNSNAINQVVVYEPADTSTCVADPELELCCSEKLEVAKDLLNLKGNVGMTARARQQLMTLLLNVASEKLSLREAISDDGATVSQAITYCDGLIDDTAGDHETAKDICDWINNAFTVPAGVIPLTTDDIAYSPPRGDNASRKLSLGQNYPNPFNPTMRFEFVLDREDFVVLSIHDVSGRLVRTLVTRSMSSGTYLEEWDGRDSNGRDVASGVYFYRLKAGTRTLTRKAILLK